MGANRVGRKPYVRLECKSSMANKKGVWAGGLRCLSLGMPRSHRSSQLIIHESSRKIDPSMRIHSLKPACMAFFRSTHDPRQKSAPTCIRGEHFLHSKVPSDILRQFLLSLVEPESRFPNG